MNRGISQNCSGDYVTSPLAQDDATAERTSSIDQEVKQGTEIMTRKSTFNRGPKQKTTRNVQNDEQQPYVRAF